MVRSTLAFVFIGLNEYLPLLGRSSHSAPYSCLLWILQSTGPVTERTQGPKASNLRRIDFLGSGLLAATLTWFFLPSI